MPGPIVFISHFQVKEGGAEGYRRLSAEVTSSLEQSKPRTLAFLPYLSDDGSAVSIVHVFGDGDAMDDHFKGANERAVAAYQFLTPLGWEIYGAPSDDALETMRQTAAASGVALSVQPEYAGGFLRLLDT